VIPYSDLDRMTAMPEFVTLSIDREGSVDTMAAVLSDLRDDEAVQSVRPLQQRSLDPQNMMALIQVATGVLSTAGTAWALIDKIRKALHTQKVKGAHLTLPNGTRVDIDQIDEEQLGQLIAGPSKDPAAPTP
jgi:hypothetical protein